MVFFQPSLGHRELKRLAGVLRVSQAGRQALLTFAGPALVASVAYLDPGNFATNIAAGGRYGYRLLWVVVAANVAAMLFQGLSAKLGIVRGQSLARLCGKTLPPRVVYPLWIVSEIGAMATDLAELLGAALGLALLCRLPLLAGTIVVAAVTWGILLLQQRSLRLLEGVIAAFVGAIGLCYVAETVMSQPDWRIILHDSTVPWLGDRDSVMLAAGIIGATVMPHAIFLHSSLARRRLPAPDLPALRRLVRASHIDVVLALTAVGLVNMAIMYVAAAVLHHGGAGGGDIESAFHTLGALLGDAAAAIFMTALLASGLSSSVVGTMAGQVIMQDFVGWRIPLWLRRLVTMAPTVLVVAWGVDVTQALIVSQVVLSLVLPVPITALICFTGSRRIMGPLANPRWLSVAAACITVAILSLNALIVLETLRGKP